MGCLSDGAVGRSLLANAWDLGITSIAAKDRIDRVKDGDVNYSHSAARATGTDLLAEDPVLPWSHGRMVESTSIDCNLIPVLKTRQRIASAVKGVSLWQLSLPCWPVARTPDAFQAG